MSALTATVWLGQARRSGWLTVVLAWAAMALLLSGLWALGHFPNGDVDDLLKAREVRLLLETGDIFNRTLPGILQPEPFVSHWPWIVDLPYAATAFLLRPLVGEDSALAMAFFAIPLLLLAPTLLLLYRIIGQLGFLHPAVVLAVSALPMLRTIGEFQPGRIDYHNLQMLLLVASVWLTLTPGRLAAIANGIVTAVALATGLELAFFFVLVLAIHAFEFIRRGGDAADRLQAFGIGLAGAGVLLYVALTPPSAYGQALCDRYSSPLALALVCAGTSFAILPVFCRRAGLAARAISLAMFAVSSAVVVALIFPHCLDGPYASLPAYVRDHWLGRLDQEKSLLARPDFVLSGDMFYLAVAIVGALASVVAAWAAGGRDRNWTVYSLFAVAAALHAIVYFRYLRFLPLFAGPGLAYALQAILPPRWGKWLAGRVGVPPGRRIAVLAPGLALCAGLIAFHVVAEPEVRAFEAAELAEACDLDGLPVYHWPAGARVIAPPLVGIRLFSASSPPDVVAVPFHTGAGGIERAYRFFDPATSDARAIAAQAGATHVAVCAWRGRPLVRYERDFPLATGLVQGKPPGWLTECALGATARLRIYAMATITGAPGACPLPRADPALTHRAQAPSPGTLLPASAHGSKGQARDGSS